MIYLCNAFSLSMVPSTCDIRSRALDEPQARELAADAVSAVGHADTAALFGSILGRPVAHQRATVVLERGDVAIVGQYTGPRLPEGATSLPEGARIEWRRIEWE